MTGNKLFDNILLAISFLGAASFLGIGVYTNFIYKKVLPQDSVEFQELKKDARKVVFAESFELPPITVNLPSRTKKLRFIDLIMFLVPFDGSYVDTLEKYKPQISDIVIEITSEMRPSKLNTPTGKMLLESRIKKSINGLIGNEVVKEILFTKFVIQ